MTTDTLPNGIVHVVNTPPASGIEPTWVIEPDLMIGSVEGDGPDVFGQLRGIAPLKDGRIAVLDAHARQVQIFGPDGQHLHSIGSQGGGPGELRSPNGLVVGPDDLLRINDPGNARLSIFDPDEGYVGSASRQTMGWATTGWDAVIDQSDGRIYELSMALIDGEPWHAIKVYDVDGVWADTIPIEPYRAPAPNNVPAGHYRIGPMFMTIPFWPSGARAVDPRGYYWEKEANVNDFRVIQTTFGGDTVLVFESGRRPIPVSAAERDSAIAVMTGGGDVRVDVSRVPNEQPTVQDIFLDDEGRIWVRVGAPDAGATYDVFNRDGRYRGTAVTTLTIPKGWRPIVTGDHFHTLSTDEHDVPYVVRARLRDY